MRIIKRYSRNFYLFSSCLHSLLVCVSPCVSVCVRVCVAGQSFAVIFHTTFISAIMVSNYVFHPADGLPGLPPQAPPAPPSPLALPASTGWASTLADKHDYRGRSNIHNHHSRHIIMMQVNHRVSCCFGSG